MLIETVVDPELASESLGVESWAALGCIDESSVLRLADGTWFGLGKVDESKIDRRMVLFLLSDASEAEELRAMLAESCEPVWAMDPLKLLDPGSEREYRAFMAGDVDHFNPHSE